MKNTAIKLVITALAFFGYGGWALYCNWSSDLSMQNIAWRAACIQGTYAGGLTLANVYILEWLLIKIKQKFSAISPSHVIEKSQLWLTVIIGLLVQYSIIIPIHLLNQTPNIFLTLLPGLIIGTIFNYIYLVNFNKRYSKFFS